MWVRFNAAGLPDWWGGAQIDGSEWIEGITEDQLCRQRRVGGKWIDREPEAAGEHVPPESEPEPVDIKAELAALADKLAELQAVVEAKD